MDVPASGGSPARGADGRFGCPYCDIEVAHKIAQLLLPALAAACVDSTTGDPFNRPASVAVAVRKDMIDSLTLRSESYVAETIVDGDSDGAAHASEPPSDDPVEIASALADDFAEGKRNIFSRVSGWLLSDSREDKVDDFVQEMEANKFWPMDRRQPLAEALLRNVDFKEAFHCTAVLDTLPQLEEHKGQCGLRSVSCGNKGCKTKFCVARMDQHNAVCLYKEIMCEQGCEATVVRRDMDRHCITVCPMRLVNCPFFQIGCQSAFPQCTLGRHCSEFLNSHLLYVLQLAHKHEASIDELRQRVQILEKSQSLNELSEALDVRSLTLAIKEQEMKMKKLEHGPTKVSETRS